MQTSVEDSEGRTLVDLSQHRPGGGVLEASLVLPGPRSQVHVRFPPGTVPGRAEAIHGQGPRQERWAAKHFWSIDDETVAYEFDAPLPGGDVRLRVPVSSR
jgi:hypothetical protein